MLDISRKKEKAGLMHRVKTACQKISEAEAPPETYGGAFKHTKEDCLQDVW